MTIQENMVVSLNYKLSNHKTGEKIEETTAENPMVFLYGVGGIIPQFEENIFGKTVGDSFEFHIAAENAYGLIDNEQIAMIPLDVFRDESGNFDEDYFVVGALIPMSDSEGNQLRGTILELTPELIKMDFNHPLAGKDLHFSGTIGDIRPATEDEVAHGHVHGEGGHNH
jgi:FKBP-type peptidyl-prolyl cis-trans isomerase SlyD